MLKQWIVLFVRSDWLLKHGISSAVHLWATLESRRLRVNWLSGCCRNKRQNFTNKRESCYWQHEQGDEIRFGSFYKWTFVCLTFIYRWKRWKKFFVFKCKLSLALLYLAGMFINKLKTKLNGFFYRMVSNTERIHNPFWRNVPAGTKQMPLKVLFFGKITWRQLDYFRAKIVIVDSSKWVKNRKFCVQLSHCFSMY